MELVDKLGYEYGPGRYTIWLGKGPWHPLDNPDYIWRCDFNWSVVL